MPIIDRFHQSLKAKLQEEINKKVEALKRGNARQLPGEVVTTAEKYAAAIMYIEALEGVLKICDEISADQYGTKRESDDE